MPQIRGKTNTNIYKKQNPSLGPVKVDFLNTFFMLFNPIFTAVENIVFNHRKVFKEPV
jgi:hypothetical protein